MLRSVKFLMPPTHPPHHVQEIQRQTHHGTSSVRSKMAQGLRTSQAFPLLLLRTHHFSGGGRKTTYCSPKPTYPLIVDLFLENPFPVAGSVTLCLVGCCCLVEYSTEGFPDLVEKERANFNCLMSHQVRILFLL